MRSCSNFYLLVTVLLLVFVGLKFFYHDLTEKESSSIIDTVKPQDDFTVVSAAVTTGNPTLHQEEVLRISQAVTAAGEKYGVDLGLILGVMQQESDFRIDAVSPKGAIGLMQVMPQTARVIADDL